MLDRLYTRFDALSEQHDVFKVLARSSARATLRVEAC